MSLILFCSTIFFPGLQFHDCFAVGKIMNIKSHENKNKKKYGIRKHSLTYNSVMEIDKESACFLKS